MGKVLAPPVATQAARATCTPSARALCSPMLLARLSATTLQPSTQAISKPSKMRPSALRRSVGSSEGARLPPSADGDTLKTFRAFKTFKGACKVANQRCQNGWVMGNAAMRQGGKAIFARDFTH